VRRIGQTAETADGTCEQEVGWAFLGRSNGHTDEPEVERAFLRPATVSTAD